MKIKLLIVYIISFLVIAGTMVCYVAKPKENTVPNDFNTFVNRKIYEIQDDWKEVSQTRDVKVNAIKNFDYVVINTDGELLQYTKRDISVNESQATLAFDVIRDIIVNQQVVGKLIIHNPVKDMEIQSSQRQALYVGLYMIVVLIFILIYTFYIFFRVILPFQKLKNFASQVAIGNLDIPLYADKNGVFGAFTESFDIMREELKASKEREAEAVKSRKELVAQMSHDIKTPVASIKAMTDVLLLTIAQEDEKKTIASISAKADQIDELVSNLFHATLEELEQLSVKPKEVTSMEIKELIKEADYQNRIKDIQIPECLLIADPLRIGQVINNIIANSYKYADTAIDLNCKIEGKSLLLNLKDYGPGVAIDELDTIFEKFTRGSNTSGKSGAGLGLYISKYLIEKMNGNIFASQLEDGFCITVSIPLV